MKKYFRFFLVQEKRLWRRQSLSLIPLFVFLSLISIFTLVSSFIQLLCLSFCLTSVFLFSLSFLFVCLSVYHQIHTLVFLLFGGVYNFFVCLSVSHSFLIFSLISLSVLNKSSILVFILYNIVYNFFVCLFMSHSFFNN